MPEARSTGAPDDQGLRFYWMTGCSSCQRTKEYLLREKVPFESINLSQVPDRMAELEIFGLRTVPVLVRDDQFVIAQDLDDVATFVGLRLSHLALRPDQLVSKLDEVLACAIANAEIMPSERLGESLAGRERPHRELVHHIFRVPEAFLEAMEGAPLTNESFMVFPGDDVGTDDLVAYGRDVRSRIARWWEAEPDKDGRHTMTTYFGEKPMNVVLERTTWHAAHHTRQLEKMVLGSLGLSTPMPLSAETISGLPLPETIF